MGPGIIGKKDLFTTEAQRAQRFKIIILEG